jgi:hypothetical protein
LKGYIYDFNPDTYVTTTEVIANYFGRTYEYGSDIVYVINHFKLPDIKKPTSENNEDDSNKGDNEDDSNKGDDKDEDDGNKGDDGDKDDKDDHKHDKFAEMKKEILFQCEIERYVQRKNRLNDNIRRLYVCIWDQCTKKVQGKLMAHNEYLDVSKNRDGLGLLVMIRNEVYNYQTHLYKPLAISMLRQKLYSYHQGPNETLRMYHTHFKNLVKVIEYANGGIFGYEDGVLQMLAQEKNWDLQNITDEMKEEAKESFLATLFISNSDPVRYGNLLIDIQNKYLLRQNYYPKTIQDAYCHLLHWINPYSEH